MKRQTIGGFNQQIARVVLSKATYRLAFHLTSLSNINR